jgi:hypothetical protein
MAHSRTDHPLLFDCTPALFSLQVVADTLRLRLPLDVWFFSESDLLTARQRNDVMGHKQKSVAYSITSSARPRSDGGIVRPSAFAALRLMTN